MNSEEWKCLTSMVNAHDPISHGARTVDEFPQRSCSFHFHCTENVPLNNDGGFVCAQINPYGMYTNGQRKAGMPQFLVGWIQNAEFGVADVVTCREPLFNHPQFAALQALGGRWRTVGCCMSMRPGCNMDSTYLAPLGSIMGGNCRGSGATAGTYNCLPLKNHTAGATEIVTGSTLLAAGALNSGELLRNWLRNHSPDCKEGNIRDSMCVRWKQEEQNDFQIVDSSARFPADDSSILSGSSGVGAASAALHITEAPWVYAWNINAASTKWNMVVEFDADCEYFGLDNELVACSDSPYGKNIELIRSVAAKFPTVVIRGGFPKFGKIVPRALALAAVISGAAGLAPVVKKKGGRKRRYSRR